MGKNHRHQKNLKSEKAKVKLKAKKPKILPKGQNITDTTFKVKKIVIREQLKAHEVAEILSRRKLNVKDLLTRLHHHNSTVRQEAIKELKEILQNYPPELLSANLQPLLQGISSLILDKEKDIRRDTLKVLSLLLAPLTTDQLSPFFDILISYLCCAMTHITPVIKEDSLLFLDVLVQSCPTLISKNAQKILPIFLDMISKHQKDSPNTRQLTTILNSRNTTIKWRTKVLERLSSILNSVIADLKSKNNNKTIYSPRKIFVDDRTHYLELYWENNFGIYDMALESNDTAFSEEDFKRYMKVFVSLMMETWLEVRPKDNSEENGSLLSQEAVALLRIIGKNLINFLEISEIIGTEDDVGVWFRGEFQENFEKFLLRGLPYGVVKGVDGVRKRQRDFSEEEEGTGLLSENFVICLVYLWMTGKDIKKIREGERENLERILQFTNDHLRNWSARNISAQNVSSLPSLLKFLRILFLKSSKILYKNEINLGETLRCTISAACRQPKQELQNQLFALLGDIVLDHNLNELHSESAFKNFVRKLPDLLLHDNIHENTIQMLNRAVLQHGNWIRTELAKKQEQIQENAKKIEIIGSNDEKESRLMICNLLHFLDGQIYY